MFADGFERGGQVAPGMDQSLEGGLHLCIVVFYFNHLAPERGVFDRCRAIPA